MAMGSLRNDQAISHQGIEGASPIHLLRLKATGRGKRSRGTKLLRAGEAVRFGQRNTRAGPRSLRKGDVRSEQKEKARANSEDPHGNKEVRLRKTGIATLCSGPIVPAGLWPGELQRHAEPQDQNVLREKGRRTALPGGPTSSVAAFAEGLYCTMLGRTPTV